MGGWPSLSILLPEPHQTGSPASPQVRRQGLSCSVRVLLLLVAWAALTGILIEVGVIVVHSSSVNAFDRHVTSVVVAQRSPPLNHAMKAATWLGSWVALGAAAVLLVVLACRRRLPVAAVALAVVAWAGEDAGVTLAKHVVKRSRPPQDLRLVSAHGSSWPSGHTAVALLVFTVFALVVALLTQSPRKRTLAWVIAALAVAAVGFSRVELGVHWATDVFASMVFVGAWLLVLLALFASDIRPYASPVLSAATPVRAWPDATVEDATHGDDRGATRRCAWRGIVTPSRTQVTQMAPG